MKMRFLCLLLLPLFSNATMFGQRWILTSTIHDGKPLWGVHFPTETVGYAVGTEGAVFKTSDSGANWTRLQTGIDATLRSVFFINPDTGWVCGETHIRRTYDGGLNWVPVSFSPEFSSVSDIKDVRFIDRDLGVFAASGVPAGAIIVTTDGGRGQSSSSWHGTTNVGFSNFEDIGVIGRDTIMVVGSADRLYYSFDGGLKWSFTSTGTAEDLISISTTGPSTGWVVSRSGVHKYSMIGSGFSLFYRWERLLRSNNGMFTKGQFINQSEGWVFQMFGRAHYTANGGVTWRVSELDQFTTVSGVDIKNRTRGWAVGTNGAVLQLVPEDVQNETGVLPVSVQLEQNYPNPFNPNTQIAFSIKQAGPVKITIRDFLGREIAVLTDKIYPTGSHTIEFDGSKFSSGIYTYTLSSLSGSVSKRMTLVK